MKWILIVISLFISTAFAGQCKFLPKAKAQKAIKLIAKEVKSHEIPVIDHYCKACMDTYVRPIVVDKVQMASHSINGFFKVQINDEDLDVAYIYINGESLASQIGCKTQAVARYLLED